MYEWRTKNTKKRFQLTYACQISTESADFARRNEKRTVWENEGEDTVPHALLGTLLRIIKTNPNATKKTKETHKRPNKSTVTNTTKNNQKTIRND